MPEYMAVVYPDAFSVVIVYHCGLFAFTCLVRHIKPVTHLYIAMSRYRNGVPPVAYDGIYPDFTFVNHTWGSRTVSG